MPVNFDYLRKLKAETLRQRYEIFSNRNSPLRIETVSDALVIPPSAAGDSNFGVVFGDSDSRRLHPFASDPDNPESVLAQSDYPDDPRDETILYAGALNPHWGHFIMDSLSRLWPAFSDATPRFDAIVFSLPPGVSALHPNITRTLELTGLMKSIRFETGISRYSKVIVAEPGVLPRHHFAKETMAVYDAVARSIDDMHLKGAGTKVFLSRAHLKKAMDNEPLSAWVDDFFRANGFSILYPEEMTVDTTIAAIRNADTVAALSGTLPHNMIFGHDGQNLIVIEKTAGINNYQQGIDLRRNLRATYVDANAMIWLTDPGLGPFIVYPNDIFRRFCADNGMSAGRARWSAGECKKALRRFFNLYERHYCRQWILPEWMECEISILREAYEDSMRDFGPWLKGDSPLTIADALSPRRLAKNLLRRLRGR